MGRAGTWIARDALAHTRRTRSHARDAHALTRTRTHTSNARTHAATAHATHTHPSPLTNLTPPPHALARGWGGSKVKGGG